MPDLNVMHVSGVQAFQCAVVIIIISSLFSHLLSLSYNSLCLNCKTHTMKLLLSDQTLVNQSVFHFSLCCYVTFSCMSHPVSCCYIVMFSESIALQYFLQDRYRKFSHVILRFSTYITT